MKRWLYNIEPPNKDFYLERCKALRSCLEVVDSMPPFLVCDMCRFVLNRAHGSRWRVVLWLLIHILDNYWEHWKDVIWTTWHMYITCKSLPEIRELIDRQLEELTGEDHREWPDVILEEDEVKAKQ